MHRLPCLPLAFLAALLCAQAPAQVKATAWPEADRLFRSDPLWLGGDAAFSVDLGRGRVLWLFGDSFIAAKPGQARKEAAFVRNSMAIQTGYDPTRATIRFYSGRKPDDSAASFFPEDGENWFWPMHGVRLGPRLLLFTMRMARNEDPHSLGFQVIGWNAFLIDNPDEEPSQWKMRRLDGPEAHGKLQVGMAVLRGDGFVYAFAGDDATHDAYLLRWTERQTQAGQLTEAAWWCGAEQGWKADPACRQVVLHDAGSEFSVQKNPRGGWLEVKSEGFGATDIALRHAERLEGPWSASQVVYRPPESNESQAFVYAGKGHPELKGGDLIVTYAANGSDERLATDMSIYFPRFVRITLNAH